MTAQTGTNQTPMCPHFIGQQAFGESLVVEELENQGQPSALRRPPPDPRGGPIALLSQSPDSCSAILHTRWTEQKKEKREGGKYTLAYRHPAHRNTPFCEEIGASGGREEPRLAVLGSLRGEERRERSGSEDNAVRGACGRRARGCRGCCRDLTPASFPARIQLPPYVPGIRPMLTV